MGNVSAELITVQSKSPHNNPFLKFSHCLKEKFSFCQVFLESVIFCLWRGEKNNCIELYCCPLLVFVCVACINMSYRLSHLVQSHLTRLWPSCQGRMHPICKHCIVVHTQSMCIVYQQSFTRNVLISLYCY